MRPPRGGHWMGINVRHFDKYLFEKWASNLSGVSLGCHYHNAVQYKADLSNPWNQICAMAKRVGAIHPAIKPGILNQFRKFVKRFIREMLTPLKSILPFEEWIKTRNDYTEKVKERFRLINEALVEAGGAVLTVREMEELYYVVAFIKDEFYPEIKFPRGIYSRSDVFKVLSGPFFKSIEEEVFKLKWFIKKISVSDRPKFLEEMFAGVTGCADTDFTAFESSYLPAIFHACEFQLYEYMAGDLAPELWDIIKNVLSGPNYIKFRSGVEAILIGKRCSGEMCTSLGNGFTNLMLILFSYWWQLDVHYLDVLAAIEGDDGNHNSYKGTINESTFIDLGFTVKMGWNDKVNTASFCGLIYEDGINIADPTKIILRFGWTKNTYLGANERTLTKLKRAKALSFAHQYPGCPIVSVLAEKMLELTRHCRMRRDDVVLAKQGYWFNEIIPEWELYDDEANVPRKDITENVRKLMEDTFRITSADQLQIEKEIRAYKTGPFNFPTLDKYIKDDYRHWFNEYVEFTTPELARLPRFDGSLSFTI